MKDKKDKLKNKKDKALGDLAISSDAIISGCNRGLLYQ